MGSEMCIRDRGEGMALRTARLLHAQVNRLKGFDGPIFASGSLQRIFPKPSQLDVDPVGCKRIQARAGIQAKLAEKRLAVDLVKIDPIDCEVTGKRLCSLQHRPEGGGPGRSIGGRHELPPIAVMQYPAVTDTAPQMYLHVRRDTAKDVDLSLIHI